MSVFIMSIKPKWARELYSGKKTVEFRKSSPPVGSLVFLYESSPVKAVTGVFLVGAILSSRASHVWYATRALKHVWKSGTVKRDELLDYSGGASGKCCAILAEDPWKFPESAWEKLEKYNVRPPQSFQALRGDHFGENALAIVLLNYIKRAITNDGRNKSDVSNV